MRMAVNIETVLFQEADQGYLAGLRHLDRQRRGRAHGGHHFDTGHRRLLQQLETRSATEEECIAFEWQGVALKRGPQQLVERIVTTNIFPEQFALSFPVE